MDSTREAIEARRPVERSLRTSDPLARQIYAQLRDRSEVDRRFVHDAICASESGLADERAKVMRDSLLRFQAETEREPAYRAYERWRKQQDDPSLVTGSAIIRRWGCWSEALSALGLKPAPDVGARSLLAARHRFSDAQVLAALRACSEALGRREFSYSQYRAWAQGELSREDRRLDAIPLGQTTVRRFGSLKAGLVRAGVLDPAEYLEPRRHFSEEELLGILREASLGAEPWLTQDFYKRWRRDRIDAARFERRAIAIPNPGAFCVRFGSWGEALRCAGLISEAEEVAMVRHQAHNRADNRWIAEKLVVAARDPLWDGTLARYGLWRSLQPRVLGQSTAPCGKTILGRFPGRWRQVAAIVAECPADELLERLVEAMAGDDEGGRMSEGRLPGASDAAQAIAAIAPKLPERTRQELRRLLAHSLAAPTRSQIRERRIGLLVELVEGGAVPGVEDYETERERRRDRGHAWPAHSVLIDHFGRWSRAVSAAASLLYRGGRARVRGSNTRAKFQETYTREEVLEAIRSAQRKVGRDLTMVEYLELRRVERSVAMQSGGPDPRVPGMQQVRVLFGSWDRAVENAEALERS